MPESDQKKSFWTTMPGILTGIAALLTAVTGLLVVMYPHGFAGSKDDSPPVSTGPATQPPKPAPIATGSSSAAPVPPPAMKNAVRVTSREDEVTSLYRKSFRYSGLEEVQLTSGQTIPFDKIKSIDFSPTNDLIAVKVTLTDGRILNGTVLKGYSFSGETDIGPFKIQVDNLKQLVFE